MSEPATDAVICPRCGQWEGSDDDVYCGFCSGLLVGLRVEPESVVLTVTEGATAKVRITNGGQAELPIVIVPEKEHLPGLRLDQLEAELAGGQSKAITLAIDPRGLPDGFRRISGQYLCTVDGDRRRAARFEVEIRSGPRVEILTKPLQFGRIEAGTAVTRQIRLVNRGGSPARLNRVEAVGHPQLRLAETEGRRLPLLISPEQTVSLSVVWDGAAPEAEQGAIAEPAGFRLVLERIDKPLFVAAEAEIHRRSLHVEPSAIERDPILSGHRLAQRVVVRNSGTVELRVERITSAADWLEIVPDEPPPWTLQPPAAGEALGSPALSFWALAESQKIGLGLHETEIRVEGDGCTERVAVRARVVALHPYADYIGIDFGTNNSVVAFSSLDGRGDAHLVEEQHCFDDSRLHLIPSLLVLEARGRHSIIGTEARLLAAAAAERSVLSIKRVLGSGEEHEFFGRCYRPEEIASQIMRHLLERAEQHAHRRLGKRLAISRAIVTVPVSFFGPQIRAILDACRLAGLEVGNVGEVSNASALAGGILLNEPAAAALFYLSLLRTGGGDWAERFGSRLGDEGALNLLVYDHGAGTLDVSLVQLRRRQEQAPSLHVLASLGSDGVGGDSFDLALMRLLVERCQVEIRDLEAEIILDSFRAIDERRAREAWSADTFSKVLSARLEWKDVAESTKIGLSSSEEVEVSLSAFSLPLASVTSRNEHFRAAGAPFRTIVRRSDFHLEVQRHLFDVRELVKDVLRLAGVEPRKVALVIHSGRQSLMPLIIDTVRAVLPEPTEHVLDERYLKVCVALGAAHYGRILSSPGGITVVDEGWRLPFAYGIEGSDDFGALVFEEIIPRGAAYPVAKERTFTRSGGHLLVLRIYRNQGSGRDLKSNREARCIGTVTIEGGVKEKYTVALAVDRNRDLEIRIDGEVRDLVRSSWDEEESWSW